MRVTSPPPPQPQNRFRRIDFICATIAGDNVDSASHNKDAPAVLKEVLELDATVSVALEFAQNNPGGYLAFLVIIYLVLLEGTLVIVTADHDCGKQAI